MELITIKEAAFMMSCHPMTVRRKMESGELGPVTKLGRKFVRLQRAAVDAYIARNTRS